MLGCSIQNAIKTLPNITNTTVTAQDLTNATTIYGSLLAHLKGQTRQIKNAVVPNHDPSIGPDEDDEREEDEDTPRSNLRLADANTPTALHRCTGTPMLLLPQ